MLIQQIRLKVYRKFIMRVERVRNTVFMREILKPISFVCGELRLFLSLQATFFCVDISRSVVKLFEFGKIWYNYSYTLVKTRKSGIIWPNWVIVIFKHFLEEGRDR